MNKRLLPLLSIIFFITNCAAPKRIKNSANLYYDINNAYNIADYNIVLKAKDTVTYFSNPVLLDNGNIKAENFNKQGVDKKMIFTSKDSLNKIVEYFKDSTGIGTMYVEFSKQGITKVQINQKMKGLDNRIVYDKFWNTRTTLGIASMIVATCSIITLFGLLLFGISEAFFDTFEESLTLTGCYIATMVYGSYDAPEVLVLRKFRDTKLVSCFLGRIFIRMYYTLSPCFVYVFKNNKPINKFIKSILDRWVKKLRENESRTDPGLI